MDKMQWARGLFLFLIFCTWVLMTSPAVLSSDHSSSKASSVLLIAMSSIVAGQNTASVPSLSSVSMSSSKVFHSSTFAMSSSSFVALSSSMATPALPLGSSKLVSSLPVVSKSVVRLNRPSRSESSPVAMSSSWAFEQGTSVLPSVSSSLLLSSAISLSSLHQSHLSFVVVSPTLAMDKSTPETPSPSSMLLASSTVVSQQSVCPNMVTLNETSGVLTSPYYPRSYPPNEKCIWKITASEGERIVLVIEDLHIRDCGSSCTCDYLEIQNGSSTDGISGRRRCRYYKDRGIVYHSATDVLRLTFVSDSRVTYWWYRGFRAIYMKVKYNATNTGNACTSGKYLDGFSGFFSTPNFPSNFSQYSRCTWNITVPSGYIIKLSFVYFRLEPNQYSPCYHDAPGARVTVTNVASDDGYQPFMLCGQSLPPPVYSVGNSVQVIFTSLTTQYPGFNATYTAITYSSVCPNMATVNEISGIITSPFYPRRGHLDNKSCSWEIRARKGKRIVFTIEYMDQFHWWCSGIWSCLCNYLEIQGGSISGYDGPIWRVCRLLTANATYDWFKERIKVLFFSAGSIRWDRRFRISYTQVNFSVSGCSNYTTLNESNRAMTYNRSISYLCDANLNGWYRFNGEAGTQMADSCVNMYHCGTESPGWLNGTHPDLNDGAVKRQVCFSSFDNCCHHSNEITVQHCGAFYVYKLERQSQCNLRYCGNGLRYAQECYNYQVLNETSRSKTYNGSYYQCDSMLSTDWYTFSGAAGNQMAESCVEMYRCGTYLPGWLSGSHPTVNEGAVQRRVCFGDYNGDCCSLSTNIRIRNCGGFYVYQLKPLTVCSLRYCGNGYVSWTPPTKELPHTTTTKVTPATGAPSATDAETTPTRAMYSEPEHRRIVVLDIDKEIIGRRGSMRQKSCSKSGFKILF